MYVVCVQTCDYLQLQNTYSSTKNKIVIRLGYDILQIDFYFHSLQRKTEVTSENQWNSYKLLQSFQFFNAITIACTLIIIFIIWAPSSEFVSSSIPHAQPFRGARDLAFCLKVPLDSLLVWASSEGSGETARMRRLAWTFAARIGDKYQIRLTRSNYVVPCFLLRHRNAGD